jgi:hypothetical protein
MRILTFSTYAVSAFAIFTMLANSAASSAPAGQRVNVSVSMTPAWSQSARANHFYGKTSGCPRQVVYVSDHVNNVVRVYPLAGKHQTICGMIGGFSNPQGLAVDLHGDLYVADTNNSQILKFRAGTTTPSLTISDPGQEPVGVCINAKGTIGVTNITTTSGGKGSLAIYDPDGSEVGTFQDASSNLYDEFFCKMDANGDVYTTGSDEARSSGAVNVFVAPSYVATDLPIVLGFPGGVDLVGNFLYIGDQQARTVTAYKDAKGAGKGFFLNTSGDPAMFEFTSDRNTFYTAEGQLPESQEYRFGNNNDINYIRTPPGSSSAGVALTRAF